MQQLQRDLMYADEKAWFVETEPQLCKLTEQPAFDPPTPERAAANLADSAYPTLVKVLIALGAIAFVCVLLAR